MYTCMSIMESGIINKLFRLEQQQPISVGSEPLDFVIKDASSTIPMTSIHLLESIPS